MERRCWIRTTAVIVPSCATNSAKPGYMWKHRNNQTIQHI